MVHVYVGKDRLDALRFRSFLFERGIAADIQELAAESSAGQTAGPMVFVVCVAEGRAAAACALLNEFSSIFRQSTDETEPEDDADDQAPDKQPEVRARIPWLTLLFCAGCIAATFASWSLMAGTKTDHVPGWGWRDGLDVADGSYWAVFTSALLHQDAEHLVMCLLGIGILGLFIERAFGRGCWIALLSTCILITGATELAAFGQLGYGSSGVLNTFYAFALIASVRRRMMPIWLFVLLSIWMGFGAILDVAAVLEHFAIRHSADVPGGSVVHLTGLAWGMLFAAAFAINWKPLATRTAVTILLLASLVPLGRSPWLAEWLVRRGERALEREGVASAIDWYTSAIQRDPKLPAAYVGRAGLLLMDSRFAEGLADVDQAVACQIEVPYARALRAQILLNTSDRAAALAAANDELNVAGPSGYGYAQQGVAHFDLNEFDAALADLDRAIKVEPRATGHWATRSSARHEVSQIDPALADADHAISLDAHNADGYMVRGMIFADLSLRERARNDLLEARSKYETELIHMPRHATLRCTLANTLLELFKLDGAPAHLASAREHAQTAVLLAPAYWEAWQVRGEVELIAGEFDDAVKDLTRALELNPQSYWAACQRGLALDRLSRPDEALRDLSRAVAANPRFAYGYRSRGLVRLRQGDFRGSIDDANVAIQLNPKFAEAYDIRGQARIASGHEAAGTEDLQRAIAIDPSLAERRRQTLPAERGRSGSPTD